MANYAKILPFDIANAPGISVTVFLSGCDAYPKCKGCFNSIAWDKDYGKELTWDVLKEVDSLLSNEHIKNLVILGGEPMAEWNLESSDRLIQIAKKNQKKVWVYTWRPFEDISKYKDMGVLSCVEIAEEGNKIPYFYNRILYNTDVIVDGRFVEEKKALTLKWKGSNNQRVIDVKKSLSQNKVVLFED